MPVSASALPIGSLLLAGIPQGHPIHVDPQNLDHWERVAIWNYLERYPDLQELYRWKERLHKFYRTRGYYRAHLALHHMCDEMALSLLPEIKTEICRFTS